MSIISWNCRGLGNPRTVQVLLDLVNNKKPNFVFLIETRCTSDKLSYLKTRMQMTGLFVVDSKGRSSGLAMFWNSAQEVKLITFSRSCIDVEVKSNIGGTWRLTGYYGEPCRSRRHESWAAIRTLSSRSHFP